MLNDNNPADDNATGLRIAPDLDELAIMDEVLHFPDGQIVVSYDLAVFPAGDYLHTIHIFDAVTTEEYIAHAVYSDRDAAAEWVHAVVEGADTRNAAHAQLLRAHNEYERLVQLGNGDWVLGSNRDANLTVATRQVAEAFADLREQTSQFETTIDRILADERKRHADLMAEIDRIRASRG